jgi:hypothetical protein
MLQPTGFEMSLEECNRKYEVCGIQEVVLLSAAQLCLCFIRRYIKVKLSS